MKLVLFLLGSYLIGKFTGALKFLSDNFNEDNYYIVQLKKILMLLILVCFLCIFLFTKIN